jgi:hypothetical protein
MNTIGFTKHALKAAEWGGDASCKIMPRSQGKKIHSFGIIPYPEFPFFGKMDLVALDLLIFHRVIRSLPAAYRFFSPLRFDWFPFPSSENSILSHNYHK